MTVSVQEGRSDENHFTEYGPGQNESTFLLASSVDLGFSLLDLQLNTSNVRDPVG